MRTTIRRDKIQRLVEAGHVEVIETYHFDDMTGSERTNHVMPAAMKPADWKDRREGVCYLFRSDFTSSSGSAHLDAEGRVSLYVHSNSHYTLRLKNGATWNGATCKPPKNRRPEAVRMQNFLALHGITCQARYTFEGSMRGCWYLYAKDQDWTPELRAKLAELGFLNFMGEPLGEFSGNGGTFSVAVRGHNELLTEPPTA